MKSTNVATAAKKTPTIHMVYSLNRKHFLVNQKFTNRFNFTCIVACASHMYCTKTALDLTFACMCIEKENRFPTGDLARKS